MNLDNAMFALDFDAVVDGRDQERILSAFQFLLLDEEACHARIAYLDALSQAAVRLDLTRHARPETAFDDDIKVLVREGTFGAVRSGSITLDRIAGIARSPQALRQAHAALTAAVDDAILTRLKLPIAGRVLQFQIAAQCTLEVSPPQFANGHLQVLAELRLAGDDERPVEVYVDYVLTTADGDVVTGCAFPNEVQTATVVSPHRGAVELTLQLPRNTARGSIAFRAFAHTYAGRDQYALPTWAPAQKQLTLSADSHAESSLGVEPNASAVPVAFGEATISWPGVVE